MKEVLIFVFFVIIFEVSVAIYHKPKYDSKFLFPESFKHEPKLDIERLKAEIRGKEELSNDTSNRVITCYYTKSSQLTVSKLDPHLCTHILYIGDFELYQNLSLKYPNATTIKQLVDMKKNNSNLKIMITLTPDNHGMSQLIVDKTITLNFAKNVSQYLVKTELDGLDIDWEFPVLGKGSKPTDKAGLNNLIKTLRTEFDKSKNGLLLTMAVAAPYNMVNKAYDVPTLNRYLDFINVMTYDLHMWFWYFPFTGHNAPLFKKWLEIFGLGMLNVDYSIFYWYQQGMDHKKITVGIPTYARQYYLLLEFWHWLYSPATIKSKNAADLTYSQVCSLLKRGYTRVFDQEAKVPYCYKNKNWITYEDQYSITEKAQWIKENNFLGAMIFDLNSDQHEGGECTSGTLVKFPLVNIVRGIFDRRCIN